MSDADRWHCDLCDAEHSIEALVSMVDCHVCEACYATWKAEFDACQHHWTPYHNGLDQGQHCGRCSGFVADEDFADLFGTAPAAEGSDVG